MNAKDLYEWRLVASQLAAMSTKLVRACDVLEAAAHAERLLDQVRKLTSPAGDSAVVAIPRSPSPSPRVDAVIPQVTRTVWTSDLTKVLDCGDRRPPRPVSAAAVRSPTATAVDPVRALAARAVPASSAADFYRVAGSRSPGDVPF